jgi:hypothetical protein
VSKTRLCDECFTAYDVPYPANGDDFPNSSIGSRTDSDSRRQISHNKTQRNYRSGIIAICLWGDHVRERRQMGHKVAMVGEEDWTFGLLRFRSPRYCFLP